MSEFIPIYVPSDLYPEALQWIASRVLTSSKPSSALGESPPDAAVAAALTPLIEDATEIGKLWDESGSRMRKVLAHLAAHPDTPVTGDELARKALEKLDRGHTVAGMMGALGRRIKHRHGGRWPFTAKWNAVDLRWEYCMPGAIAAVISKLATK